MRPKRMRNFLSIRESKTLRIGSGGNLSAGKQLTVVSNLETRRSTPERLRYLAMFPLRLMVGFGFMAHGYAKLTRGPEHFISILGALGVPAPAAMGWLTIGTELVGGLALLVGIFVTVVSAPLA